MSSTAANLLILVVYSIIYVAFGFFLLRPVEKFRFLSLVSVPVVLTALYLYLSSSPNRDISSLLIIGNLGGAAGISLLGAKPGALMFVMLPSVMMYLGMILRRYLKAGDLCMAHLKNNGIALTVHISLAAIINFFLNSDFDIFNRSMSDTNKVSLALLILLICFSIYILCGLFLLRPVNRFPLLSVLSVAFVIIVLYICAIYQNEYGETGKLLLSGNPTLLLWGLLSHIDMSAVVSNLISIAIFFLSPWVPSLLVYLGMILRKHFRRVSITA